MKTSILIYATCFIVTGCSAQLRFPSLSSALSSLTGFGSGSSSSSGNSAGSTASQSAQSASPYSGLVRDYGRNLMMAMSNIYPTLFKPPQSQQQQAQPAPQSYDQAFGASQYGSPSLFPSQSAPSFSFGGSTFSISPSLPFGAGSLSGAPQAQASAPSGSHSPFSASFGSSINSPSSFGPLSSNSFFNQQSLPSFAPASSYNAAFEAANGGPSSLGSPSSFGSAPGLHSQGAALSQQALLSQSSNNSPINSYNSLPSFNGQHDSAGVGPLGHQQQQVPMQQQSVLGTHSSAQFGAQPQHNGQSGTGQYASQQYRPDVMSIAASAPVPSSNSYSNYGGIPSGSSSQQAPASSSSYQQPSYR